MGILTRVNQSLKTAETFLSTVNYTIYFEIISIIVAVAGLVLLIHGILTTFVRY